MESTFQGNFDSTFDRVGLDMPAQYPLMAPSNPMAESEVVPALSPIALPSLGEYRSWNCRSRLDNTGDAPLGSFLGKATEASDHTDMMWQGSDIYALPLVSHRLATRIQQVLNQVKVSGNLFHQPDVLLPGTTRAPVIQNMRLTIIFQSLLESAEFFGAHLNPSVENTTHPPFSGNTQEHPRDANLLTAICAPSVFRETQTNTIGKTGYFRCTICRQRFSYGKKFIRHMEKHAAPSDRLARRSAVAWKGVNPARTVPSSFVHEPTPDTDMFADNVELYSGISSEFDLGAPFVDPNEQINNPGEVNGHVPGMGNDLSGAGPAALQPTQVALGETHEAMEEERSIDGTPREVNASMLLARGSGGDTIRIDPRGNAYPPSTPNLHHCPHCSHSFTRKAALGNHLRSHSIKRLQPIPTPAPTEWKCTICNKVFITKQGLINHGQVHRRKTYQCSMCANSYRRENDLANHLISHEDRRAVHCVCGRRFFKLIYLEYHETVCAQHQAHTRSKQITHSQPRN